MKTIAALLLVLTSVTSMADTCFTRQTQITNNEVSLAHTVCFAKPELELNYFENSYALLRYSIDGQRAFKRAVLKGKFDASGKYVVEVSIENNREGGMCDRTYEANSTLTLNIAKDGSQVDVAGFKGEVLYTYDNCHDRPDLEQTIQYSKN